MAKSFCFEIPPNQPVVHSPSSGHLDITSEVDGSLYSDSNLTAERDLKLLLKRWEMFVDNPKQEEDSTFITKQFPIILNEVLQREPLFMLDELQIRILHFRLMLEQANQLNTGSKLTQVLNQHLIYAENAARALYQESATAVHDSMWPLYERVLQLPTIKPDLFGAAVSTLYEKLPSAIESELVLKLKQLLPELMPPENYFWKRDPETSQSILQNISSQCTDLLNQLNKAPEGFIKGFVSSLESINDRYVNFMKEYQTADQEQQQVLCVPKAQLSGVGLGFFSLDQGVARRLLCRNEKGLIHKENLFGTHAVCCERDVFFKPNPEGRLYIGPELEFAIYAFYQLLAESSGHLSSKAKPQTRQRVEL
jgi:hypothetical protein